MVRILLLFAFLVQSTFVQAHVHAAPLAVPVGIVAEIAIGPVNDLSRHGPNDASTHCFACWEAASAGLYVLPVAAVLSAASQPSGWTAAQSASDFALGKFAHGWLGRAPPQ